MSALQTYSPTGLVWTADVAGAELPASFGTDVYLKSVPVAGIWYHGINNLAEPLQPGDELSLVRAPGNAYDRFAVAVLAPGNVQIGFVPRAENRVYARLMDAGKHLHARVLSIKLDEMEDAPTVRIGIYMQNI